MAETAIELMIGICTIFGCVGQIFMSGKDVKNASKKLKEEKAKKSEAKNQPGTKEV